MQEERTDLVRLLAGRHEKARFCDHEARTILLEAEVLNLVSTI